MVGLRYLTVVAAIVALAAALPPAAGSGLAAGVELRLHVRSSDRADAVYHVACLAGSIACTKAVFEQFWKQRLGLTSTDQANVDAWRQVMKEISDDAPARIPAPLLLNVPRFHPGQAARETVMVAAVESRSSRDLARR